MYALPVVKWNNIIHYTWEDKNGSQPRFSVKKNFFLSCQFQAIREAATEYFLNRKNAANIDF